MGSKGVAIKRSLRVDIQLLGVSEGRVRDPMAIRDGGRGRGKGGGHLFRPLAYAQRRGFSQRPERAERSQTSR